MQEIHQLEGTPLNEPDFGCCEHSLGPLAKLPAGEHRSHRGCDVMVAARIHHSLKIVFMGSTACKSTVHILLNAQFNETIPGSR